MNDDPHIQARTATFHAHRGLRLLGLLTVIAGVLALAAAAFVFSYAGVHHIAVAAGVPSALARFYPALPDAVLVVACAAALSLRGAKWWTRSLAWLTIIILAAAVGTVDAVHAMGIKVPRRPLAATVAVVPWVLLLLGFRLWFTVLRHPRHEGAQAPAPLPSADVAADASAGEDQGSGAAAEAAGPAGETIIAADASPAQSPHQDHPAQSMDSADSEGEGLGHDAPAEPATLARGLDLILGPPREKDADGAARAATDGPGRHEAPGYAVTAPPLSAPVPEAGLAEATPGSGAGPGPGAEADHEAGDAPHERRENDAAEPSPATPRDARLEAPAPPPPDFHRLRSSPVRPGE